MGNVLNPSSFQTDMQIHRLVIFFSHRDYNLYFIQFHSGGKAFAQSFSLLFVQFLTAVEVSIFFCYGLKNCFLMTNATWRSSNFLPS